MDRISASTQLRSGERYGRGSTFPAEMCWKFSGPGDDETLLQLFGSESARSLGGCSVADLVRRAVRPNLLQSFVFERIGHVVLRPPLHSNVRLSPLQTLFIELAFALSTRRPVPPVALDVRCSAAEGRTACFRSRLGLPSSG